jgi:hypothetical protein
MSHNGAVPHGEEVRSTVSNHEARAPSFETPRSLSSRARSRDPLAARQDEVFKCCTMAQS